ncbi:MAG: alkaline phosphatase D family protein, partial [Pseudomonadota bacterium]
MTRRRTFLKQLGAGATLALSRAREVIASPKFTANPFSLGIASGDPTDRSVILWTRLAPEPLKSGGGMPALAVPVKWQVASDRRFRRIVQEGTAMATPDLAHSVHVDVQSLNPKTEYWYRFSAGNAESKIGRTLTLPSPTQSVSKARFTTCSCQHFEQGYFSAYSHMIEDDPDFVVHLGDYIYDVSFGASFRNHVDNSPLLSVEDFRRRHALYKSDEFLQSAHRNLPFFAVLDNHDALPDGDLRQVAVRAAAYQAWYEHMPIRGWYRPGSAALATYQSLDLGTLLRLNILDTRQFRSNANIGEGDPKFGFGIYRPDVPARHERDRTMLGAEQMNWLDNRLSQSRATWNVVASTVPVGEFEIKRQGDARPHYYYSSWDGYTTNREALFQLLNKAENAVVLSGDIHS